MDPLVPSTETLEAFPGGPFAPSFIASASAEIRSSAGWHIAPAVQQTRVLWCNGGPVLKLPTLKLDIEAPITVAHGDDTYTAGAFDADPDGLLYRLSGWPYGRVTVTFTHGYEACPAELLPVLAEKAQGFARDRSVKQESILSRSVSYGAPEGPDNDTVIARYRL